LLYKQNYGRPRSRSSLQLKRIGHPIASRARTHRLITTTATAVHSGRPDGISEMTRSARMRLRVSLRWVCCLTHSLTHVACMAPEPSFTPGTFIHARKASHTSPQPTRRVFVFFS